MSGCFGGDGLKTADVLEEKITRSRLQIQGLMQRLHGLLKAEEQLKMSEQDVEAV